MELGRSVPEKLQGLGVERAGGQINLAEPLQLQGDGCGAQIGVKNPEGRGCLGAPNCSQIPLQVSSGFPKMFPFRVLIPMV